MTATPTPSLPPALPKPKATRHYTGAALARRRAWGKFWAQVAKDNANRLRENTP